MGKAQETAERNKDLEIYDKDVEIAKLAAALGDSKSQPSPLHI